MLDDKIADLNLKQHDNLIKRADKILLGQLTHTQIIVHQSMCGWGCWTAQKQAGTEMDRRGKGVVSIKICTSQTSGRISDASGAVSIFIFRDY